MMLTPDFWIRLFLAALVIVGVWAAFGNDMILGPLGDWLEARFDDWYLKPIFTCPVCMASVHGTYVWFIFGGEVWVWPFFILALAGLMRLVSDNLIKTPQD